MAARIPRATTELITAAVAEVALRLQGDPVAPPFAASRERYNEIQGTEADSFAATMAETLVCVAACAHGRREIEDLCSSLRTREPFLAQALRAGLLELGGKEGAPLLPQDRLATLLSLHCEPGKNFYELFLASSQPRRRRTRGVYYTPTVIVDHIVRRAHTALQELGLALGLADTTTWGELVEHKVIPRPPGIDAGDWPALAGTPYVQIYDPAAGTGVFLTSVIALCQQTLAADEPDLDPAQRRRRWRRYLRDDLLPRLHASEIMMTPAMLGHLELNRMCGEAGLNPAGELDSVWGDALTPETCARVAPVTVVLGNPPYRGLSRNRGGWIDQLLEGRLPADERVGSYYEVDGAPLRERKTWLRDDYVKFFRLGQHLIDQSGSGLLCFVANHSYLDNPTFRGMRQQLLESFERIELLDLHGSAKRQRGDGDESLFNIQQGTVIGLFGKGGTQRRQYASLRGTGDDKARRLREDRDEQPFLLTPRAPFYFLVPRKTDRSREYEAAWPLDRIMPRRCTGIITARDRFAVDFSADTLLERIGDLRAKDLDDDTLRARFFAGRGSHRYPPGDTRGWKLPEARARLRADRNWRQRLETYWYRPLDRRLLYYAPWIVDWPRLDITRHLLERPNLALYTCRQTTSTPWRHVLPTRGLTDDCYVSNRTRERGYLFPLYLVDDDAPNLAPEFLAELTRHFGLRSIPKGVGDLRQTLGPEDVVAWTYALLNASGYRQRYGEELQSDFPRLPLPATRELFAALCERGHQLLSLHLLEAEPAANPGLSFTDGGDRRITRVGEPRRRLAGVEEGRGRLRINQVSHFDGVPQSVWELELGAYPVCHKWLADRKRARISLDDDAVSAFLRLVSALDAGISVVSQIDTVITEAGGFPAAFAAPAAV